ncbi:hypothetical protein F5888DRAFT_1794473 [Russula emetica]|nr:hypothetical protein F5888DRAFT_1794473 [Russula emetica]
MSSPLPSPLASPKSVAAAVGKKSPARSKSSRVTKPSASKRSTAAKKSTTAKKPTLKKAASKSSVLDHPSWKDIIKEAITQHREDARTGVSRSAIKKFAEEKYKLDMTSGSNLHQLNLALIRGVEKEIFVFPKGPSGKVKLAPKRPKNAQPPSRKAKSTEATKAAPAKKAALGKSKTSTNKTATAKKSVAAPKKAPAATKKTTAAKKPSTKKTTSAKNDTKKASPFRMT